MITSQYELDG